MHVVGIEDRASTHVEADRQCSADGPGGTLEGIDQSVRAVLGDTLRSDLNRDRFFGQHDVMTVAADISNREVDAIDGDDGPFRQSGERVCDSVRLVIVDDHNLLTGRRRDGPGRAQRRTAEIDRAGDVELVVVRSRGRAAIDLDRQGVGAVEH